MYVCMYVCIYIYTYIHTCIHTHTHITYDCVQYMVKGGSPVRIILYMDY